MFSPRTARFSRRPIILSCAVASLIVAGRAHAANKTWDGGGADNNWLTAPNWDSDIAPLINDALFFAGTTRLAPVNNFAAGTLFNGITFNSGAGAFTLSGANSITLTPGISAGAGTVSGGNITNNSTNAETLTLPTTLATGNHTIVTAASSGALNINGPLTRSAGATAVFTKSGGNINLTSSGLANTNGILGGWGIIGNDWASLDGSNNVVGYSGYTPIAAGAITSGSSLNYKFSADTGNLTAADGTAINTLQATISAARSLTITGTMKLGSNGGIYRTGASTANSVMTITGGTLTASGGGEITLACATTSAANFAATNNNLRVDSIVANDGANPVSVSILGYLDIRGANTYTGGTFINQGRVQASTSTSVFGTGAVTVYPGAEAFLNLTGSWANNFLISGLGPTEASGGFTGPGAIRLGASSNLTGSVTLQGDSRISSSSQATPTISGQITGSGNLELLNFASTTTTTPASLTLANTSIASPNNWTGNLQITASVASRAISIKLGAADQIPDTANVTLAGSSSIAQLDLNGFGETIGSLAAATSTNSIVTNTAATPVTLKIGATNASATFGGIIQDAGASSALSIVKVGSGTQTLGGTNTLNGTVGIESGTLSITGSLPTTGSVNLVSTATSAGTLSGAGDGVTTGLAGNVTVAANNGVNIAHIAPGTTSAAGSIGTLTLSSLTMNGGDLAFDLGATSDLITVTGAATFAAASTITPSSNSPNGTYTVLTAGTLNLPVLPTVISPTDTRKVFAADFGTLNTIKIVVSGSSKTLNWTGLNGSAWDINTTTNWNDGVIAEKYFNGDTVNFGDGPANRTLTLTGITVTPAAVNVSNSAGDYTISGTGAIGGSAALTKSGSSKLIIATNNSFTGGTTNSAGGTIQVGNGGTTGSLGTGTVANDGTLTFNRSDAVTVLNVISGAGEVRQSGNGTLILSGANTYTGITTIGSGTVRVTSNASLGDLAGGPVNINAGGTLDLAGNTATNNANFGQKQFNVAGDGVGGLGAIVNTGTANQQNAFQRTALTADASFGGTTRFDIRAAQVGGVNVAALDLAGHTLTKNGTFFFALVGADVSDGDIVVNGGTLNLEATTSVPDFGSGKKITFNSGTNLQLFNVSPNPSVITRPMVFNGSGIQIGNSSTQTSLIGSPMLLNGDVTLTALSATPGALTLAGNITETGGAHSITKTGNCTIVLSGTNSFTGGTTINAGTLTMGSATALGSTSASLTVNTGGTLDLNGNSLTAGTLSGTGGTITNSLGGPSTFTVGSASNSTFSGAIVDGSGQTAFTKQGNGRLILTGANTYTGVTTVNAGSLIIGDGVSGSLTGTTAVNVASGATLGGSGSITAPTGTITLAAGSSLAPGNSTGMLTLDVLGGFLDVAGAASGTGAFKFELGTTSDRVALLEGGLKIGAGVLNLDDFNFTDSGGFGAGTYTLFDGNTPITGTLGSNLTGNILGLNATLGLGDNGNDLVLVVVPEPTTFAALLGGVGLVALRRKRTCAPF